MIALIVLIIIVVLAAFLLAPHVKQQANSKLDPESGNELVRNLNMRKEWWGGRRMKYNIGLVVAGVLAFVSYITVGELFIAPFEQDYEVTLFTIGFQGLAYLFMMLIANQLYNLGFYVDHKYNQKNSEQFRTRLFNLGFWFSCLLPFSIPLLVLIIYWSRVIT